MMTNAKLADVLDFYDAYLHSTECEHDFIHEGVGAKGVEHLLTMLPKMRAMLAEIEAVDPAFDVNPVMAAVHASQREKLMRWLGFVQGVLWTYGVFTITQLKTHNMPAGEAFHEHQ